ncbi:hypothetical protein JW711_00315 [Candidatus Woesearchaeota archaeon]|nr:hypothetical protein [Candidatus Woesearchaeota archaeon]
MRKALTAIIESIAATVAASNTAPPTAHDTAQFIVEQNQVAKYRERGREAFWYARETVDDLAISFVVGVYDYKRDELYICEQHSAVKSAVALIEACYTDVGLDGIAGQCYVGEMIPLDQTMLVLLRKGQDPRKALNQLKRLRGTARDNCNYNYDRLRTFIVGEKEKE